MTIPARLGPYEVERELGAGAMGVVYLARDERLDRRVALKSLPEAFAEDDDRMARFEREARMLAALHHPHVATLFGLEELDGRRYLVMEYVEGETLEKRLAQGGVDVEEALKLADQIARGLAAAHDRGIIHRDLKPGNVLVTPSGGAKVVDFGLAKDVTPAAPATSGLFSASESGDDEETGEEGVLDSTTGGNLSLDSTLHLQGDAGSSPVVTAPGSLLGTAAYMSPEQARGRPVDRRCDVWAFGCVLFEMLTRRRPFAGRSVTETLVAVLQKEPDWDLLPARTPAALYRLLERCLRKDPDDRLRDLGDASLVLREIRSGGHRMERTGRGSRIPWLATGVLVGVILAALFPRLGPGTDESPRPPIRFGVEADSLDWGGVLVNNLAVAPDGRSWVYRSEDESGDRLVLRRLGREQPMPIPGTEGAVHPFWSPDARFLGFVVDGSIRRVEPFAGSPRTVLSGAGRSFFGAPSWSSDGSILYAVLPPDEPGVYRVPADGGEPRKVLGLGAESGHSFLGWPEALPGGDRFLVLAGAEVHAGRQLFLASADGGDDPLPLSEVGSRAAFVEPDRLLYVRRGQLLTQRLDLSRPALVGDPVELLPHVANDDRTGAGAFGVSPDLLVSIRRTHHARLRWFDAADGTAGELLGEPGSLSRPRISPQGDRVAVARASFSGGAEDLWVYDLERGVGSRLTNTPAAEGTVVWSPDGERLAYFSDAANPPDVRIRRADPGGAAETLVGGPEVTFPSDWSPDGRTILYASFPEDDLYFAPLDGSDPRPWLVAPGVQSQARFSPDGRRVAFASNELGSTEVFFAPSSDAGRRVRVSIRGGEGPVWSPRGDRIYFHDARRLWSVAIDPEEDRVLGRPEEILALDPPDRIASFDGAPDGSRFLVAILDEERYRPTLEVRVGWRAELP